MSSDPHTPAEIVAVGRELLTGRTVDSNSAWIAGRLTELGFAVARIVAVDDDPAAVAREIEGARARGAALVVTTGGLGPTLDDRTLAGVAAALGRPLAEHTGALAFVARRYAELAADGSVADAALTPPRRKMAVLPAGAEPVDNPKGSAPGVVVREGGFLLLAVPGVPAEMRAVLEAARPTLEALLAAPARVVEREVGTGSGDESVITVAVERVMEALPGVYLKSLATRFAPGVDLRVRITARAPAADEAEALVAAAADRLARELASLGSPPCR
jgi:molybdopterin-biosynthesis enzyme MoeA-like protein